MEHGFTWFRFTCLMLVLIVLFVFHIDLPKVHQDVVEVKSLSAPAVQVVQYPIGGCSLTRVHFEILWQ
jgi:hypothetical protein